MSFSELSRILQGGVQTETALSGIREQIDTLESHMNAEFKRLREELDHAEVRLTRLEQSISQTLGVVSSEPGETIPLPFERRVSEPCPTVVEVTTEKKKSRPGRRIGHQDLKNRGSRVREDGREEWRYDSNNYVTQAKRLGVGTIETKRKRRRVWLTRPEVKQVVDALRPIQARYQETRRRKRQVEAAARAVAKLQPEGTE